MPRRSVPPKYRTKCTYGRLRALVTLRDARTGNRRDFHLGEAGSPESREKYARLLAQWETCGRRFPDAEDRPITLTSGPTITQLCFQFWAAVEERYSCKQLKNFEACVRLLRSYYGETPASGFGPKALRLLRDEMVRGGKGRRPWSRNNTNRHISLIFQIFRWGVSHELIGVTVLDALKTIEPLRRGQTTAPEAKPVRPVPDKLLEATLPHLNRQVRAIVELQLLTGARPSELLKLRPCDILTDECPNVWIVHLDDHKTAHHGRDRAIYFGPQAQAVLQPFIEHRSESACLFSPVEAEMERRFAMHAARKTPLSCGNRPGSNKKESPRWKPRDCYDTPSYLRAITRACEKAFPPPAHLRKRQDETISQYENRLTDDQKRELKEWRDAHHWHPYQLRHNAATALRREFGLEAAQLILGHASAQITDAVYADRDQEKILKIVQKIG